jgi:hypothetical protein
MYRGAPDRRIRKGIRPQRRLFKRRPRPDTPSRGRCTRLTGCDARSQGAGGDPRRRAETSVPDGAHGKQRRTKRRRLRPRAFCVFAGHVWSVLPQYGRILRLEPITPSISPDQASSPGPAETGGWSTTIFKRPGPWSRTYGLRARSDIWAGTPSALAQH